MPLLSLVLVSLLVPFRMLERFADAVDDPWDLADPFLADD